MAVQYNPNYLFLHREYADADYIALQGSSRSGKTFSIYDFIINMFCQYSNAGIELDVVRDSLPVLKATVVKEFIDRLTEFDLYDPSRHHMSDKRIEINGNFFNYYSVDDQIKARGRKRHILWLNEPNDIAKPIIDQLLIRTTHKVIIDFNPSEPAGLAHWLYDEILTSPKCKLLKTTYKDNPFLTPMQFAQIEKYKETDPTFYAVFGLGERSAGRKGQIYTHFQKVQDMPAGDYFYGLDFGKTNNATALVRMLNLNDALYCQQVIYQTGITTGEIVKLMKQANVSPRARIIADSAEPLIIKEMCAYGFNVVPAVKGAGSITGGINRLKDMEVFVTADSKDIWREVAWYAWELDKSDVATNVPIDLHNDAMDAMRYGVSKDKAGQTFIPNLRR